MTFSVFQQLIVLEVKNYHNDFLKWSMEDLVFDLLFSNAQLHCVEILVSLPDFSVDLLLSYWDDGMGRFKTKICTSFDCPSWNNLTSNIKRILNWFVDSVNHSNTYTLLISNTYISYSASAENDIAFAFLLFG